MSAREPWQPDLLKGPRQRGVHPPAAKEVATHCAIADAIRATRLNPGWTWWHTPNGGWRTKAEAGMFQRMGVDPGVPDFLLFGPPHARLHGYELKRRGEHPTEAQIVWGRALLNAGGLWAWGDTYDAAIAQLIAWDALRDRIRL
jgi:hypothetical protein